jgi:predicted transcriptional regulator|tara:strand:+ start:306 stop:671 length:366 start_codon:yes stop_codon:yes gene_type:complete
MAPKHVDIVKRKIAGVTNKNIAVELNVTAQTVGKTLQRQDAQELRALLEHYNMAMDGPNDAHRRRMLWEIAVDNQAIEPKVSISSIVEINKMNGTYQTAAKDTAINITINNNLLPKGKLDT